MDKSKNDERFYTRRSGSGRPIAGLVLILIGVVFLLMYAGVFNPGMIGEFFGNFGSAIGQFFGNFGQTIGEFFGNLGGMIGRFWPVLLIVAGLALLLIRRKPTTQ
jgi:hypothetical protein